MAKRLVEKKAAEIDLWLKEIAPTNELRKWFSHDPRKWIVFKEISANKELLNKVKQLEQQKRTVTLLFSAKDKEHNNAIVLQQALKKMIEDL